MVTDRKNTVEKILTPYSHKNGKKNCPSIIKQVCDLKRKIKHRKEWRLVTEANSTFEVNSLLFIY